MKKQDKYWIQLKPLYKSLEKYSMAMTRNREDAMDMVQEAVLAGYERFDKLKSKEALLSFLFTCARRIYFRKIKSKSWLQFPGDYSLDMYCSTDTSPETKTDIRILYEHLDKLKPEYKELFVMFELTGLSIKEIEAVTGLSQSNIKTRLHRARKMLSNMLNKEQDVKVI